MHVACPKCGTTYALEEDVLSKARLRVRCRRCRHVWSPGAPHEGDAEPPAAAASNVAVSSPPTPAPAKSRRLLPHGAYALALIMALIGTGSLAYAFRDHLPGFAPELPVLTSVEPVWSTDGPARRLILAAELENPAGASVRVDGVHVRFLSGTGAWIGERLVAIPPVVVAPGATVGIEATLDTLPEGTVSLELSAVPHETLS